MDSRRWLVGLGALAALLAAALIADLAGGDPARPGGRIFPDWDPAAVRVVRLERRGRPALVVARDGAGWRLRQPLVAPADPAAVADVLGTLEIMAARRRDEGRVTDPALVVTVERTGRPPVTLDIASDTGKTDRVWLSRRGESRRALVDGYQVRALDLAVDDLRERRPFRGRLQGASRMSITAGPTSAVLEGPLWRIGGVRADPERVQALVAALERLRAGSFLPARPAGAIALSIAVVGKAGSAELSVGGDCPGEAGRAADSPLGAVCLPPAELDPLAALADDPASLEDRRLLAAAPDQVSRVRIAAGARSIEITRAERAEVVRDWAERFAAAAAGRSFPAAALPAIGAVEVDTDGGREVIEIVRAADRKPAARRAGEPVAFRLADPTLVDPAPRNFRSLDLVSADPTALRSARRGGEHIERGELLEEWRARAPAGATVDTAAAQALADTVAALRALRVAPEGPRRGELTITIELAPPPGESQPVRRRLHLAAGPDGRCTVRLDDDPTAFELAPEPCAALQRPWTR